MYLRQPEVTVIVAASIRKRVELGHSEKNPVKDGRVQNPYQFPWSSVGVETSLDAARKSARATT